MSSSNNILQALRDSLECYIDDSTVTYELFRQEPDVLDRREDISGSRIAIYEDVERVTTAVSLSYPNTSEQTYNIDINAVVPYSGDKENDVERFVRTLRDKVVEWSKTLIPSDVTDGHIYTLGYNSATRTTRSRKYATKTLRFVSFRDLNKPQ